MRRVVLLTAFLLTLPACTSGGTKEFNEFAHSGRIQGTFRLGDRFLHARGCDGGEKPSPCWVEMIELSGPPTERCGPGDCGVVADTLAAGLYWRPGRWRVIPPHVEGWREPASLDIVVEEGKLTTFQADYQAIPGG